MTQNDAAPLTGAPARDSLFIPRGSVTAEIKFYTPPSDNSKPFNYPYGTDPPEGQPRRNFGDVDIPVEIKDIRGREHLFNLDDNAFKALEIDSSTKTDFASEDSIKRNYYPEVEQLLVKNVPGAKRVLPFDHTVRPSNGDRPPVLRAHIDQNRKAASGRVHHFLPDEAEDLLKDRVRIINVWRPLNGPVRSSSLAFADSKTVGNDALIDVEHRYADRTGETLSLAHRNEQWYYWSGINNNERLLLQIFDSEKESRLPHSAFVDPRTPVNAPERESIEVRSLVFG